MSLINRQAEKALIDDAFRVLHNYNKELLRTPLLDFYGVEGIGKTSLLDHVEQQCRDQAVRYIRINASKSAHHFSDEVIKQVRQYDISLATDDEGTDVLQQSAYATRALLERGIAVMLLDSVDTTNEELVEQIAATLREVIDENKLLVVATSRRSLFFDTERTVARKLTTFRLKPFDQKSCETYLNSLDTDLDAEVRNIIYDWTRGYPLAMQVMTEAITEGHLDPRIPDQQKELVAHIVTKVIHERIFARVAPDFFDECLAALTLLSVPRRFNLVMMQELIERFEPDLKYPSGPAYMELPGKINQATDVLSWNTLKAGFSVDDPVRTIFLLKSRIENPERYLSIHRFLAQLNEQFAARVHGTDHIRYLREYLYHSAQVEGPQGRKAIIEQTVNDITGQAPVSAEAATDFEQFREEFGQDEELKDALGEQANLVVSRLYQHLARVNRRSVRESSGPERIRRIQEFFYYIVKDPMVPDLRQALRQSIEDVLEDETAASKRELAEQLLQNAFFKEALGKHFELFASILQDSIAGEG